jgi:hypothetical protein
MLIFNQSQKIGSVDIHPGKLGWEISFGNFLDGSFN